MKKKDHPHLRVVTREGRFEVPRRYAQSTSGRSDSTTTLPPDSRSMRTAKSSPQVLSPYAMLFRCPTVVSQRSAKSARSGGVKVSMKNSLNSIADYHHMVTESATPFREFTNWCSSADNNHMTREEKAVVRRTNLRRFVDTQLGGNVSELARLYARHMQNEPRPGFFNEVLKGKRGIAETLADNVEAAVRLKPGQLSIPNSTLEMSEPPPQGALDELREEIEALSEEEQLQILKELRERRRPKRRVSR